MKALGWNEAQIIVYVDFNITYYISIPWRYLSILK